MVREVRKTARTGDPAVLALAAELRTLRSATALSLRRLQFLTHSSDSSLSRYFTGRTVPPWAVVQTLCEVAGRDPDDLRVLWQAARQARFADPAPADEDGAGRDAPRDDAPTGPARFVGREAQIELLAAGAGSWAVDGMPGVGKTALVVHAARQRAAADGIVFLDLHGHTAGRRPTDPAGALELLLRAVGRPDEEIPEEADAREAAWRSVAAERDLTVVLDNAADADQVRPLLPGGLRAAVLVTSRRRLVGLPGVRLLTLDVLSPAEAVEVFADIVGAERAGAEPAACVAAAELCGRLPLALQIAGARMQHRAAWTFDHLTRLLGDQTRRGAVLGRGDSAGVAAALALSVAHLDPSPRRLFAALGFAPGPVVDPWVAAALTGRAPAEAEVDLEALVDANLLTEPAPGRYRLHDLTRELAQTWAAESDDPVAGRNQLIEFFIACGAHALKVFAPANAAAKRPARIDYPEDLLPPITDRHEAAAWFEQHVADLPAVAEAALAAGVPERVQTLARQVNRFFLIRGHTAEWIDVSQAVLQAAQTTGDRDDQVWALLALGAAHRRRGDLDASIEHLRRGAEIAAAGPPVMDAGYILNALAVLHADLWQLDEAIEYYGRAVEAFKVVGPPRGAATAQCSLAGILLRLDRTAEAMACVQEALVLAEDTDAVNVANAHLIWGNALIQSGDPAAAAEHYQAALQAAAPLGYLDVEAGAYVGLAKACRAAGDLTAALAHHDTAAQVIARARDHFDQANALNEDAETSLAAGLTDRAHARATLALRLAESRGNRLEKAAAQRILQRLPAFAGATEASTGSGGLAVDSGADPSRS